MQMEGGRAQPQPPGPRARPQVGEQLAEEQPAEEQEPEVQEPELR
jgi:hypothetical protein